VNHIKLNDQLSFAVGRENKRLRLIVFDGSHELVCHKASKTELEYFIKAETAHLFKGRLQLDKSDNHITIHVKGTVMGIIEQDDFVKLIN